MELKRMVYRCRLRSCRRLQKVDNGKEGRCDKDSADSTKLTECEGLRDGREEKDIREINGLPRGIMECEGDSTMDCTSRRATVLAYGL